MNLKISLLLCLLAHGLLAAEPVAVTRIGFGSCLRHTAHPMLDRALAIPADLFILLGDNIYADTTDMNLMRAKYDALKQSSFFQGILQRGPVLATWDDHDYGANDAGADYPMKVESQQIFLDFLDEPADSVRRKTPGIYEARTFGPVGKRVQVILLDTRYFRSPLKKGVNDFEPAGGPYVPNPDPKVTVLGEAQWSWLEEQFNAPAEIRIVASSIQFVSEFSGSEAWSNMPLEKQRLLELIRRTRAGGVLFISGDRHWAELSRMDSPAGYPIYDLTSSAMTQVHPRGTPTPNKYRDVPITYHKPNLGLMKIDWQQPDPLIHLQLLDVDGAVQIEKKISLSELQPGR